VIVEYAKGRYNRKKSWTIRNLVIADGKECNYFEAFKSARKPKRIKKCLIKLTILTEKDIAIG